MSYPQFSEGTKRLLHEHTSLAPTHTRELGVEFAAAQARVCGGLARMQYPLERMMNELERGELTFFREGSDQDRKDGGKKTGYRFAGISPSLSEEYRQKRADRDRGVNSQPQFIAWVEAFLRRFTFEVIEQIAQRAAPLPAVIGDQGEALASALRTAREIRDRILAGNLLLVAQIAIRRGRFQRGFTLDELFTAGIDGLLIAINRYDPAVALFSTYATPWISMAIDRFAANHRNVIRLPIGLQDKARKLGDGAGLIPSTVSLEEPLSAGGEEGERKIADLIADPAPARPAEQSDEAERCRRLTEAVAALGGLKHLIIALRSEVGDAAGVARALFRQEMELSRARGRASAEAARKTVDLPARLRPVADWPETAHSVEPVTLPLPIAV